MKLLKVRALCSTLSNEDKRSTSESMLQRTLPPKERVDMSILVRPEVLVLSSDIIKDVGIRQKLFIN